MTKGTLIDRLGSEAAEMAMRAAGAAFATRNYRPQDWDLAVEILRGALKAKLPEALADARDALDAGLNEVAAATFRLSIRGAGVRGAQQIMDARI